MILFISALFVNIFILDVIASDPCNTATVIEANKRSTTFIPGEFDALLCDSGGQIVNGTLVFISLCTCSRLAGLLKFGL